MGIFSNYFKSNRHFKEVNQCRDAIGFSVANIVMKKYDENPLFADIDANVFGAQVTNYLMGTHIDSALKELKVSPDVREQIIKIKDKIVPDYSMQLLENDSEIMNAVVLSLRQWNYLNRAQTHSIFEYNNLPHRTQIDRILARFDSRVIDNGPNDLRPLQAAVGTLIKRAG